MLKLDTAIRFAGIATLESDIIAAEYRKGTTPLLTGEESKLSMTQSLIKAGIRRTQQQKLGNTIYAAAVYEKVKRATITLFNEGNKADAVLMVSFEKEADHEDIITKKIMPFLREIGKGLDD